MLSVICPIYNEEKYIAQFLDSLLMQDYPKDNLEILSVDVTEKSCAQCLYKFYQKDEKTPAGKIGETIMMMPVVCFNSTPKMGMDKATGVCVE